MATRKKAATGKSSKGAEAGSPPAAYAEAEEVLAKKFTAKNAEEAAAILREHLEDDPDDVEGWWRIAQGYLKVVEKETNIMLEERAEYFPILKDLGAKALEAAEKAVKLAPDDSDAVGWCLVAYGYYSVSIGVIKAVLGGAATRYLKLADELNALDDSWLSGAAYRALGRFYREAPWPKRNVKKSIESLRKALQVGPKRLENKLHLAMALKDNGEKAEAKSLLESVVKGKPEASEKHFFDSLIVFAKAQLADLK